MSMKKNLATVLTTALLVGTASTTFASANPFSDVPRDHWAYDAVYQLFSDGVVEGYGDGNFVGDKAITRYEMAQMVAKAMTKQEVASAEDKALIDKLSAEFSEELNNLGVRVANLERNADKVKWNGEARYTYTSTRHDTNLATGEKNTKTNDNELLVRLEPTAEVNDHWKATARLEARVNMDEDTNDSRVNLKQVYATGTYGDNTFKVGKVPMSVDNQLLFDDEFSGATASVGSKNFKVNAGAGRWSGDRDTTRFNDTANYQYVGVSGNLNKFDANATYHHLNSDVFKARYNNENADIWSVGATYKFDNNVTVKGAYATNPTANISKKSGSAEVDYKGAKASNVGTWGAYVAYRVHGANVSLDPNFDGVGYNQKGWEIGANYTLFPNAVATVKYFNGKDMNVPTAQDDKASKLFGRLQFFF